MTKRRSNYGENCWRDRTSLELALIGVLLAAVLLSVAFAILITVHSKLPHHACNSSECINQASTLLERIDLNTEPCVDFYKFACGKFLTNSHGNKNLGPFLSVQDNVDRQLLELYSNPVQKNEPRMVKVAKKLFSACMDIPAIESNGLISIRNILKELGGWPVVDGLKWNSFKFDWIEITYKLRELGLPFAIFFDLLVTEDPLRSDRYILEISIPTETQFFNSKDHLRKKFMANIAIAIGADKKLAYSEMEKVLELGHKLQQRNYSSTFSSKASRRSTIFEFNEQHKHYLNWLEFINTLVGPTIEILNDDFVIFPQFDILNNWLYLIAKTPKREIANYMLWKVMEETILYLTRKLQNRNFLMNKEDRIKFCLQEAQKKFSPNPLNIMYAQKYLTDDISFKLGVIANSIKETFAHTLNQMNWIEEGDKKGILKKITEMKLILGAPNNYRSDTMFKEMEHDLMPIRDQTFLTLIRQANKNLKTGMYKRINRSRNEIELEQWYQGTVSDYILYDKENNMIRIPITLLQDVFFNNDRPFYLNYGGIGSGIAHEMTNLLTNVDESSEWSNATLTSYNTILECIKGHTMNSNFIQNKLLVSAVFREILALKITYSAYENWINEHSQEPQLIATQYSPKQLFWISIAFTTCQPIGFEENMFDVDEERNYYQFLVNEPMRNNIDFSKDFKCPMDSYMNPKEKCEKN